MLSLYRKYYDRYSLPRGNAQRNIHNEISRKEERVKLTEVSYIYDIYRNKLNNNEHNKDKNEIINILEKNNTQEKVSELLKIIKDMVVLEIDYAIIENSIDDYLNYIDTKKKLGEEYVMCLFVTNSRSKFIYYNGTNIVRITI